MFVSLWVSPFVTDQSHSGKIDSNFDVTKCVANCPQPILMELVHFSLRKANKASQSVNCGMSAWLHEPSLSAEAGRRGRSENTNGQK